jgi:hypothetical protein
MQRPVPPLRRRAQLAGFQAEAHEHLVGHLLKQRAHDVVRRLAVLVKAAGVDAGTLGPRTPRRAGAAAGGEPLAAAAPQGRVGAYAGTVQGRTWVREAKPTRHRLHQGLTYTLYAAPI